MHMFEVNALHVGMRDFIGRHFLHQQTFTHNSNARACFFGAEKIVRCHQNGGPAFL